MLCDGSSQSEDQQNRSGLIVAQISWGLQMESVSSDKEVQGCQNDNGCKWIFNPPHSSHTGGRWERIIGLTRRILDSMLLKVGPTRLTHEVLTTFMAEVSVIRNAWLLVSVSTDPDSPFILTPATLLTQKISALPPPKGGFDEKDLYSKQWRQVSRQHLLASMED